MKTGGRILSKYIFFDPVSFQHDRHHGCPNFASLLSIRFFLSASFYFILNTAATREKDRERERERENEQKSNSVSWPFFFFLHDSCVTYHGRSFEARHETCNRFLKSRFQVSDRQITGTGTLYRQIIRTEYVTRTNPPVIYQTPSSEGLVSRKT